MRCEGIERLEMHMEKEVNGMRSDNEVDQRARKVKHMLDGVHRDARPWTDTHVSMMKRVCKPVEGRPMKSAMDPVEMER